jgi:hypothetical protein
MANRPAILTLPGLSTTTLLANLANVMDLSDGRTPVVLVDRYDYERLRGRHIKGIGENQKAPYLGMVYDELRRRGIIHLIDYSKYYSKGDQRQYLQQNQKLIEEMPGWLHRQMAVKGVKRWIYYGRGTYQEPVRSALGEDEETFAASRHEEEKLLQKMERGRGDPISWNKKLLNKSVAALEIRHQANQNLRLDVECIVGGPEHGIITDLLNTARSNTSSELSTDILDVDSDDITTEIPYSKGSDPLHSIEGLDPEMNTDTRNMFDTIMEVAADIVDRGGNEWVILGPHLAIPQYTETFNTDRIRAQINGGMDVSELTSQTKQVFNALEENVEQNHPTNIIRYESEKIAESHDVSNIGSKDIESIVNQAISTSNYSVELDSLTDENDLNQAAIFTAASILSDPIHRYNENDIYRHSLNLAARFDFSDIAETELKRVGKEASGTTWGSSFDWIDDVNHRR